MTDFSEHVKNSDLSLPPKVIQYEHFLNDTLRGDLKYVKFSHTATCKMRNCRRADRQREKGGPKFASQC